MTRNLLIGIAAVGVISATTTVCALASTAHARTTTAVQASLNYCSHQTGGQRKTAPAFQQCMATRGYQLASTLRAATAAARQRVVIQQAAASRTQGQWGGWESWGSSPSSSSASNLDDEVRHIDEMNRMQQQANSDAMNATIQATNAANAAAQQQIQLQQDLANMPPPAGN
jgi:hypothetical protein